MSVRCGTKVAIPRQKVFDAVTQGRLQSISNSAGGGDVPPMVEVIAGGMNPARLGWFLLEAMDRNLVNIWCGVRMAFSISFLSARADPALAPYLRT
jgi:hypothetical protein